MGKRGAAKGSSKKVKEDEQLDDGEMTKSTIKDFEQISAKWKRGKLDGRVTLALKNTLFSLYEREKINEEEKELLFGILKRERAKDGIKVKKHWYMLNEYEASQCEQVCKVISDNTPPMHRLVFGAVMPFFYDGDADKYHIYPTRVIPSEHQIDLKIARKNAAGFLVDPDLYPEEKELIRHIILNPNEFKLWFEEVAEDELEASILEVEEEEEIKKDEAQNEVHTI